MLVLVPLAITHETYMDAYTQVPKVFVLRSLTLFLAAALVASSALALANSQWRFRSAAKAWRSLLARHPARLVLLAAGVIVYANLLATALSPVPQVSIAGADAGRVSGGLFTLFSYLLAFAAIATHLRTRRQLLRMLWAITGAAWLLSLYGIGQHFGIDWFLDNASPPARVTLTFGNAIFASAVLTMTIPLSLGLASALRGRFLVIIGGVGIVAPQLTAIAFTLTRGGWLGGAIACFVFLVIIGWYQGRLAMVRPVAVLGLSLAIALLFIATPVPGAPQEPNVIVSRIASIPESVSPTGGLSARYAIWSTTVSALLTSPWPSAEELAAIPVLYARALRPLLGYGPDTYAYVYPLTGDTLDGGRAEYAHNFVLREAVEIGVIGAAAYVALIAALGLVLVRMLIRAKRADTSDWRIPLLAGLLAALIGRSIEQLAGVAQISDLLLSWVLAGGIVALASSRFEGESAEAPVRVSAARGPRAYIPLVGAGLVALVLVFTWNEIVLEDAYAARLAAQAHAASVAGDTARSDELLREAISLSPGAAVTRLGLADRMFDRALVAPSPLAQAEALVAALHETTAVQARNPLDGRAWARSVRINGTLDALIEGGFAEDALRDSLTLAALYPGFWQPRLEVAATRLLLGDPVGALQDVGIAKSLGAEGPSVLFVEAMGLLAVGQRSEARAVADQLLLEGGPEARAMHSELMRNLGQGG